MVLVTKPTKLVAVTGAFGMAGRHIAAALEGRGWRCVKVGRSQWDLREWKEAEELDRILGDAEAVVHAGAAVPSLGRSISDQDLFDTNVRASLCLGEWSLSRDRGLVLISGAAVYKSTTAAGIVESDPLATQPASGFYGFSKILAEQVLTALSARGLRLAILRPSSIYGSGIPETRMVGSFVVRAARGEDIVLKAPVDERVNLLHASDLGSAVVRVLEVAAWDVFNVASAKASSIAEIAEACVAVVGKGRVVLPTAAGNDTGPTRYQLDCTKAAAAFGFAPTVDLASGLQETWLGRLS